jgi:alkanesulfonate monooxygenase SsuD/methylene tetrahydromethanopterin reductase-like flavin-dependent oxidoreductase (luciferase family)
MYRLKPILSLRWPQKSSARNALNFSAAWSSKMPSHDRSEFCQSIKVCWTDDDPEYHGGLYSFGKVKFEPMPMQEPHPPIWVGGNSRRAMRRAVELGDTWHPGWLRPEQLAAQRQELEASAAKAGRDPATLDIHSCALCTSWIDLQGGLDRR